jgi:lysylphosphatidylglycerol synthetase-like protein (DUF2156 family)
MLRTLLAAFATAQAASKARRIAQHTAYGLIAISAVIIALVFAAMALFFFLSQTMSSSTAAAIVAAAAAVLAGLIAIYARWQDSEVENEDIFDQLGLSSLGISNSKDVEAIADQARTQIRRVGPINVALAAIAAGFLLGRRI